MKLWSHQPECKCLDCSIERRKLVYRRETTTARSINCNLSYAQERALLEPEHSTIPLDELNYIREIFGHAPLIQIGPLDC